MSVVLLADPAEYPLTLAEAKTQCGVEGPDFDSELEVLLAAATGSLESFTGLSLARRRWRLVLDGWADAIELPRGPVRNVDAVRYFDATGFRRHRLRHFQFDRRRYRERPSAPRCARG